jgi:hypothetical protein
MVSEANPYLWATAASAFAGLAAGQALRAFIVVREGTARAARRRPSRIARAIAFLSLGILALAGLLVLSDKSAPRMGLVPFAALAFLLSLLSGFRPLVLGAPLALACAASLGAIGLALFGWLSLRPPATTQGSSYEVASLLPYEVGASSFRGHLELPERDSVPVAQEVGLGAAELAVSVESLALAGPLAFLGDLALASVPPSHTGTLRLYRVVGISAPGGLSQSFPVPAYIRLLDFVLPLPPGAGTEPGRSAALRSGLLGLASRSRLTSPSVRLVALQPVSYSLIVEGGEVKIR